MADNEKAEKPNWVKIKPAELESIAVDLAKQGKTYAEIGVILRDQHGIPKAKLLGKRISYILRDAKTEAKNETARVKEKMSGLNTHIEKNKHDKKAKRSLMKNSWVIHKLEKN